MIRQLAILAVAAACLATSTTAGRVTREVEDGQAEAELNSLLTHIYRNVELESSLREELHKWDIEADFQKYDPKWQAAINEFLPHFKSGVLPRGRIASIYYPAHLKESILLFKIFYRAPTLKDFLKIVYWTHTRVNEYVLKYALGVALVHHPATKWIPTPPPFQVYPEFFFNDDVIKQLYDYKISLLYNENLSTKTDHYVIEANYTNPWYTSDTFDYEYKLTYFTEDIGLNTFYHDWNIRYPFWLSSVEYPELIIPARGSVWYYLHRIILNRYFLERLSHGLSPVHGLDWKKPIRTGYSPYMSYSNGLHFPVRKDWSTTPIWMNKYIDEIEEYESRLTAATDSGFVFTKDGKFEDIRNAEGFNKLLNLAQGNNDSVNYDYYGSVDALGRRILGFSPEPHNREQLLPSALEHYATSLRDPAFYRFYGKLEDYFLRYMTRLPPHTPEELGYKGVAFKSVDIVEKEVFTFFEPVRTTLDGVSYFDKNHVHHLSEIAVRQQRLNHNEFTYKIDIDSDKETKAIIRVFLGANRNIYGEEISDKWKYFYEVDHFTEDLKPGLNSFLRKSTDAPWYADDYTGSATINEIEGGARLKYFKHRSGIPARLMIPKGRPEGLPLQWFFYVSKFDQGPAVNPEPFLKFRDTKPIGFPMDRPIYNFDYPNMYFLHKNVYHKEDYVQNLTTE